MARRLTASRRRARTGTCATCHRPVTATQSSYDMRTWTMRHRLTHMHERDCAGGVTR